MKPFRDRVVVVTGVGRAPELTGRPDNLWSPPPGERGAHGRFDDRAEERSAQLWMAMHRGTLAAAALSAAGAALLVGATLRRERDAIEAQGAPIDRG